MAQNPQFLTLLPWKCASRHNGVHFFDASTTSGRPKVARACGNFNILTQNVLRATTACTFSTSPLPKVVRDRGVLTLFTSKCASRRNGVHFFDIATSKSGPELTCFCTLFASKCASRHNGVHFFHISTSKSRPNMVWFCTFLLQNVLRATTAVHFFHIATSNSRPDLTCFATFDFQMCFAPQRRALFSTTQLPKVVREWRVLTLFYFKMCFAPQRRASFSCLIWPATSAPAALASLLFDPPEPQNTGKTQCFSTSLPFRAHASSLFWLSPSLIFSIPYLLPSDFLHVWASAELACVFISPYCRKFSFQTSFE